MYTIREASTRSGVGVPLLRAWERRYGVVRPTRTASGYRLYDDEAIDRLRAMRALIADGWSARQAAERIGRAAHAEIVEFAGPWPASGTRSADDSSAQSLDATLVSRVVDAARAIDGRGLEEALDEAFAVGRFEAAADRIVMPALRAIGLAWERGEVDVAGEHAASHAVLRRLAMAYEAAGEPPTDEPILVGLGPGSHHELGAFAFAVAARRAGMPILYLGPNLPAESWTSAAVRRGARGAVIGVPTKSDVRAARTVIQALGSARPGMLLAVGGDDASRVARTTGALELPAGGLTSAVDALRAAFEVASATRRGG
jgi:DNA-binding transcriptional MerR regulator